MGLMRFNWSNRASCCSKLIIYVILRYQIVGHYKLSGICNVLKSTLDISHRLKSLFLNLIKVVVFTSLHYDGGS